jgi:SAM-dependent methyltransferase
MKESCPVCNNINLEGIRDYHNHSTVYNDMQLLECSNCKMVFAFPMPSENEIELYNSSYFKNAHGEAPKSKVAKSFFSGIAKLRYDYILTFLNNNKIVINNLLEIGPGIGYFAQNWLEKNPSHNYYAIETDSSCYNSLQKIGVRVTSKDSPELKGFDIVIMSHVLEHVSSPVSFLEKTAKNLKKGGVLFIEVPCMDYKHKAVDEPHLLFFEKEPMIYLLKQLGFEDIKVSYHGQEIEKLKRMAYLKAKYHALRSKLISFGIVFPFSKIHNGMETLSNPLERAAVKPFKAHIESSKPSWWIRAIAIKK